MNKHLYNDPVTKSNRHCLWKILNEDLAFEVDGEQHAEIFITPFIPLILMGKLLGKTKLLLVCG
jgi:hypothetical protein